MTAKFLDIFSKKQTKEPEKPKIIADYREKNSLVISVLMSHGAEVELKELKVADYIIKDVAIERKTVSDFLSSMTNKRLLKQLEEIQQYENRLLIIEGIEDQELYNDNNMKFPEDVIEEITHPNQEGKSKKTRGCFQGINSNAIRGFLLSISLRYKVPIIFTKNSEDTAKFLLVLAKKRENEISLKVKKFSLDKKERMQYILEGFPGIGPKTARKLLETFENLKNVFNASKEDLQKCIGKKAEIFKIINDQY